MGTTPRDGDLKKEETPPRLNAKTVLHWVYKNISEGQIHCTPGTPTVSIFHFVSNQMNSDNTRTWEVEVVTAEKGKNEM